MPNTWPGGTTLPPDLSARRRIRGMLGQTLKGFDLFQLERRLVSERIPV